MKGSGTSCRLTLWVALAAVPPVCAIATLAISPRRASSFRSVPNSSPPPPVRSLEAAPGDHFPLALDPDRLSLGVVSAGQKAKATLNVTDIGRDSVFVDRIETGCPCLTVTPSSIRLMSGETGALAVDFDPAAEPDFRGGLVIDITGFADGKAVFRIQTRLRVVSGPPEAIAQGEQEGRPMIQEDI